MKKLLFPPLILFFFCSISYSDVTPPQRTIIRKNSGGSEINRRRVNLIEGTNTVISVNDDSANNEIDVTINQSTSPTVSTLTISGLTTGRLVYTGTGGILLSSSSLRYIFGSNAILYHIFPGGIETRWGLDETDPGAEVGVWRSSLSPTGSTFAFVVAGQEAGNRLNIAGHTSYLTPSNNFGRLAISQTKLNLSDANFEIGTATETVTTTLYSTGSITTSGTSLFNGDIKISSGVLLNGASGISGQVLTSGGAGTIPTWTTTGGGGGYALEPATVTIQANKGITGSTITMTGNAIFANDDSSDMTVGGGAGDSQPEINIDKDSNGNGILGFKEAGTLRNYINSNNTEQLTLVTNNQAYSIYMLPNLVESGRFTTNGFYVPLFEYYASSAVAIPNDGAATSPSYTLTPIKSYYTLNCVDPDGCSITMGEAGMTDGNHLQIVNIGTCTVTFSNSSGVSEMDSQVAMPQYKSVAFWYATDRWVALDQTYVYGALSSSNTWTGTNRFQSSSTFTGDVVASSGVTSTTYTATARFRASNGTAALPSYAFTNVTNGGMYTDGTSVFLINGGSSGNGMQLDASGRAGFNGASGSTFGERVTVISADTGLSDGLIVKNTGPAGAGTGINILNTGGGSGGARLGLGFGTGSTRIVWNIGANDANNLYITSGTDNNSRRLIDIRPLGTVFVTSVTVESANGFRSLYGIYTTTISYSSATVGTVDMTYPRVPCADAQLWKWNAASNFWYCADDNAGGGGAAALSIGTGTLTNYTNKKSSPTAIISFDGEYFTAALAGSATGFISINKDTFTLLGPTIDLSGGEAVGDLPANRIAAGTIDSDVMASSATQSLFYSHGTIRSNLGLAIGSNVQAWDATLDDLAAAPLTEDNSVDVGAIAAGTLPTDVMASSITQSAFYSHDTIRSNLGLAIGSNVQAWDATLDDLAAAPLSEDNSIGVGAIAAGTLPSDVIASSIAVNTIRTENIVNATILCADVDNSSITCLGQNIDAAELPADGYASTYVNTSGGDIMAGPFTVTGSSLSVSGNGGITSTYGVNGGTGNFTTELNIPDGANPTCSAAGDICLDSTDNTLVVGDGSANGFVLGSDENSFTVTLSTWYVASDWNGDHFPIWQAPQKYAVTITTITAKAYATASSTVTFNLEEVAENADFTTAGTDVFTVAEASATVLGNKYTTGNFTNTSIAAGAYLVWDTDSAGKGTTARAVTITVYYKKERE